MSRSWLLILSLCFSFITLPMAAMAQLEFRSIDSDFSNGRFQIGDGLPVPITVAPSTPTTGTNPFSPPFPEGPVRAPFDKAIQQGTAAGQTLNTALPSGRSIVLPAGLLTIQPPTDPGPGDPAWNTTINTANRRVKGVFLQNSAVFEVETRLGVQFPITVKKTAQTTPTATEAAPRTFAVGGRTGASTVYVCITGSGYNPNCLGPGGTPPTNPSTINGLMTYTKTANQFGGPAHGRITGRATVWAKAAGTPPCDAFATPVPDQCQALLIYAHPANGRTASGSIITGSLFGTVAAGGPFGFKNTTPGAPNPANQLWNVAATAGGLITNRNNIVGGGALTNRATSFGGPFTTGRVTVQVTEAIGANETFMLTGSDQRVSGSGTIMLVAGAISDRNASGPNANRAWLALVVPEPGATLGAAGALLALLGGHGLVRRRSR